VLGSFEAAELADEMAALVVDGDTLRAMRRSGRDYVVREHSPERFRELLATAFEELNGLG
jgi:hypothetical protein